MVDHLAALAPQAGEQLHTMAQMGGSILPNSGMNAQQLLVVGYQLFQFIIYSLVAIAGVVGAVSAAMTRDDAYDADSRQSKMIWVAILAGSSFIVPLSIPILSWVGMVVIGIYWFDVRPSLRALINGENRWD